MAEAIYIHLDCPSGVTPKALRQVVAAELEALDAPHPVWELSAGLIDQLGPALSDTQTGADDG